VQIAIGHIFEEHAIGFLVQYYPKYADYVLML